jgi:hypothetical protein
MNRFMIKRFSSKNPFDKKYLKQLSVGKNTYGYYNINLSSNVGKSF